MRLKSIPITGLNLELRQSSLPVQRPRSFTQLRHLCISIIKTYQVLWELICDKRVSRAPFWFSYRLTQGLSRKVRIALSFIGSVGRTFCCRYVYESSALNLSLCSDCPFFSPNFVLSKFQRRRWSLYQMKTLFCSPIYIYLFWPIIKL